MAATVDPDRVARLPRWARQHIEGIETINRQLEQMLTYALAEPWLYGSVQGAYIPLLGVGQRARIPMGHGYLYLTMEDGALTLHHDWTTLAVLPTAANAVKVRVDPDARIGRLPGKAGD